MTEGTRIAEDVWRVLPDECKTIMKGLREPFISGVASDIDFSIQKACSFALKRKNTKPKKERRMEFTVKQKKALWIFDQTRTISAKSGLIHTNTLNTLYLKGVITKNRYANGEFWELTDKGWSEIKKLKNK